MAKIFITRKISPIAKELLEPHFEVDVNPYDRSLTKEELLEAANTYDAILSMFTDSFDRPLLEQSTRLSVLSNFAIGLDNIDLAAAHERGIAVYNLPDVVTESTADLTFALFLSFIRRIPEAKQFIERGEWTTWYPHLFLGEELAGKTFGIVGFGRCGRAVARRALGFGLKVKVWHYRPLDLDPPLEQVSWEKMLATADYLSLHVPLKEETRFLIDTAAFAQMERHPVLINMARGAIIDPDALVHALKTGQVRGAALDVTYPEPIPADHPLCHLPNCLIVPHLGAATVECRHQMAKRAAENLLNHLAPIYATLT